MSANQKPRSDAVLKTLPPDRQIEIIEHLHEHSLKDTAAWLRADGIKTSTAALSEFRSWWLLKDQLKQNESTVVQALEDLRKSSPGMSEQELETAGQKFFSALAIQQQDSLTWKRMQDSKTRREIVKLSRERFQRETCELFLKWYEDKRAREIAESNVSHADKIARLRQTYFADVDEIAPSVEIPK